MPISPDDRDDWLSRLDADPNGTVLALATRVEADAARLDPRQMLRIGNQQFTRSQLEAVVIQMRIPARGFGQREIAMQYITDAAAMTLGGRRSNEKDGGQ